MPSSYVPFAHCSNCLANSEGVSDTCPVCHARTVSPGWAWRCDICGKLDGGEERAADCCEQAEEEARDDT